MTATTRPGPFHSVKSGGTMLLQVIARELANLSKAESRLAGFVIEHPDIVITMSMVDLKQAAKVSDPTIIRFSRRFGCSGYPELKVRLAQSLAPKAPFAYQAIKPTDTVSDAVHKTLTNSINSLQRFMQDLDAESIERAVDRLLVAREVHLFGLGISETNAFDAEHKLLRLGIHCNLIRGQQRQALLAPTLRPEEVALFYSHSGATRILVQAARTARSNGVGTVAVTAPQSPLAGSCDVVIGVPRYEHSEVYTPLTARLNHFIVTNMLVSAIGLKQGRQMPDNLAALDSWLTEKLAE